MKVGKSNVRIQKNTLCGRYQTDHMGLWLERELDKALFQEPGEGGRHTMTKREEVLKYGLTFKDTYVDTPFRDDNWVLLRYRKNRKAFAWTYERNGHIWVNVKVEPQWRDFWRDAYPSVLPGYHQNKEHWNSIILDGSIPDGEIRRMIAESYDLIVGKVHGNGSGGS